MWHRLGTNSLVAAVRTPYLARSGTRSVDGRAIGGTVDCDPGHWVHPSEPHPLPSTPTLLPEHLTLPLEHLSPLPERLLVEEP